MVNGDILFAAFIFFGCRRETVQSYQKNGHKKKDVNNVNKHPDAGQSTIRLLAAFPNIILRIEDDGRGFDVKKRLALAPHERRMGLRSMQERGNLLEGKMNIRSQPSRGTRIFIEVPFKALA